MGYIFDALNKQNGDKPQDSTPLTNASDISLPRAEAEDSQAAPSDQTATFQQSEEQDVQEPFRLADIELSIDTDMDGNAIVNADEISEWPTEDLDPIEQVEELPALAITQTITEDAPTEDISIDRPLRVHNTKKPKTSWWSRVLGRHLRGNLDDRLVAMTSPASAMSEEYRSIRTSILARHENERHLVHTITSATPQEGKTITCVNLGLSFAELRNRNTIIIECDLRLPTFAKLMNCDNEHPGLIDYLRGEAKLADVIQQIEGSPLHIITAGGRVSDEAVQLISSQRMSNLIQGLRAKYDHVIIDTPPVLQLADAGILGSQSDEVLVVARMRRTPRPLVEQAINTLTSYNAEVSGIIATDNPRTRGRAYKYGYRYGYGYGYTYGYTPKDGKRKNRDAA